MNQTDQQNDQELTQGPVSQPVGSINKETGPISEYVKLSEAHELHPEVKEAGVEIKSEEPSEDKQIGIVRSIPEPVISEAPTVSLTQQKSALEKTIKTVTNPTESKRWYFTSRLRQLLKKLLFKQ